VTGAAVGAGHVAADPQASHFAIGVSRERRLL
jgi:hypothetical protein